MFRRQHMKVWKRSTDKRIQHQGIDDGHPGSAPLPTDHAGKTFEVDACQINRIIWELHWVTDKRSEKTGSSSIRAFQIPAYT